MNPRACLLLAALLMAACGRAPRLPAEDLAIEVRVGLDTDVVALGRAIPLEVVRIWKKSLVPAAWDDGALAPLVVRLEDVATREDTHRVEETRRYRGYAFTLDDVRIPAPAITARPVNGGPKRVARGESVRLRVKRALDAANPGAPELPGAPLARQSTRRTWVVGGALALALLLAVGVLWRRRRHPTVPDSSTPRSIPPSHERTLTRLRRIGEQTSRDEDDLRSDVIEVSNLLRDFVAERFQLRIWERTTEEFAAAPDAEAMTESARNALNDVLTRADRVKYAAHVPSLPERGRVLEQAQQLVHEAGSEVTRP